MYVKMAGGCVVIMPIEGGHVLGHEDGDGDGDLEVMLMLMAIVIMIVMGMVMEKVILIVMSMVMVLTSGSRLLKLSLGAGSEKSVWFRVLDVAQYLSFPFLRFWSGPYAATVLYNNLPQLLALVSAPALLVFVLLIMRDTILSVLFAASSVRILLNPQSFWEISHSQ